MTTKTKPQVFIASSVEGLNVADAINLNLDHDTYPTLWRAGTFRLGSNTIDDLVKKSSTVDFAVFVFTADDVAKIREQSTHVVRDNVVFELGLFIGALGKERCYVIRPRDTDMHLPSDLLGVTVADYEANRPDGDLASAVNAACKLVKDAIRAHGEIVRTSPEVETGEKVHIPNPPEYILNATDLKFLGECVGADLGGPGGIQFYEICNNLGRQPRNLVRMSAIKLVRLGLVEKVVEEDDRDGVTYYVYSATENGLDIFLKNEPRYAAFSGLSSAKAAPNFADMDDDIPF
jgi:hypothetical protein